MLESLTEFVSGSAWTYAIVLGIAALDSVFPIVPSEATLVAAAALASSGELELSVVLAAAAAGAFAGDTGAYVGGRLIGPSLTRRIAASRSGRRRLAWAKRQLRIRGGTVILVSRFVPGGRTATMLTAGAVALPWRRFLVWDGLAALVWAGYGGSIGYLGGTAFENKPLQAVGLALALAAAVGVLAELGRRLVVRMRRHQPATERSNTMVRRPRGPFSFLFARSAREDYLARYIVREHARGRSFENVLSDSYVLNRSTPEQRARLLERPELIEAMGRQTLDALRLPARDQARPSQTRRGR